MSGETKEKVAMAASYTILGAMSAVINIFLFYALSLFGLSTATSNIVALTIAILFSFFTNKRFVFKSDSDIKNEIVKFFSSRVLTGLIETVSVVIFVDLLNMRSLISKLLASGITVVINYILSKKWVFQ